MFTKINKKLSNNTPGNFLSDIQDDNRGMGTLEIVLIIIVILAILVIFRDNIVQLINTVFAKINTQVNSF